MERWLCQFVGSPSFIFHYFWKYVLPLCFVIFEWFLPRVNTAFLVGKIQDLFQLLNDIMNVKWASAKIWKGGGGFCHLALICECSTLQSHVLALSTQCIVWYLSVISGVLGMKYNGQKEVVLRKENEHEIYTRKHTQECDKDNKEWC